MADGGSGHCHEGDGEGSSQAEAESCRKCLSASRWLTAVTYGGMQTCTHIYMRTFDIHVTYMMPHTGQEFTEEFAAVTQKLEGVCVGGEECRILCSCSARAF
eukprot:54516-Eustigmatos_ZCMA.PRE.1